MASANGRVDRGRIPRLGDRGRAPATPHCALPATPPAVRRTCGRHRPRAGADAATATEGLVRRIPRPRGRSAGPTPADHRRGRPLPHDVADNGPGQSGERRGCHRLGPPSRGRALGDRRDQIPRRCQLHRDDAGRRRRRHDRADEGRALGRPAGSARGDRSGAGQPIDAAHGSRRPGGYHRQCEAAPGTAHRPLCGGRQPESSPGRSSGCRHGYDDRALGDGCTDRGRAAPLRSGRRAFMRWAGSTECAGKWPPGWYPP